MTNGRIGGQAVLTRLVWRYRMWRLRHAIRRMTADLKRSADAMRRMTIAMRALRDAVDAVEAPQ